LAGGFYLQKLRGMLDAKRLNHSLGVRDVAVYLARLHGAEPDRAALAGLLHDCARNLPGGELLALARSYGIPVSGVEQVLPVLLHAPVGARLVREQFGVEDEAVLGAIARHTLGDGTMHLLDKVVFVADKVEPGRRFSGVENIRALARRDLNRALLACFDMAIGLALRDGRLLHPQMIDARNRLLLEMAAPKK